MASFASTDISKSELPDNDMNALEFPGGIAYDHEALPKLVAVHTLIEVNPGQINAQDVSVTDTNIKKTRLPEVPTTENTIPRHGSRRWIIRSKPELPFGQLTTAPETPKEVFQAQSLSSPSCHEDAFPKTTLFTLCSTNHANCYEDLGKRSQGKVCENWSQCPPNQELPTRTASKDTSTKLISRHLDENQNEEKAATVTDPGKSNEIEKEKVTKKLNKTMGKEKETSKSFKWHYSNQLGDSAVKLGRSLISKQDDSAPVVELKATRSDANGIPSVKFLGHSVQTVREVGKEEQEVMGVLHDTSLVPSEDSITYSAERKGHFNETSKTHENAFKFCSDPTSNKSKNTIGKANDNAMASKESLKKLKQRVKVVSKKNLASSSLNLEQETSNTKNTTIQKELTKPGKTPLSTHTTRSAKRPSSCCSRSADNTSPMKNSDASRNGKLSLRERVLNRIKRIKDNMKSYKETPEATNLYAKLAKYRKLGFGVASSLAELSKNGEINTKLEAAEDGQVNKNALSEELLEEVVLMETLRKDCKTEFTTEQKELHMKLNEKIKSKNGMKEKEMKNNVNGPEVSATKERSATTSESACVQVDEGGDHVTDSTGCNAIQELKSMPEKGSDTLNAGETLKEKHEDGYWNGRDDDVKTAAPEKRKSLSQCLDKLKTITTSVKRPLDNSEKENILQANDQDSVSFPKRPRKAAPRRLSKGGCPSYSDDNSISPDTSSTDLPHGINLTSSQVEDHLSISNLSASDAKGQKTDDIDEPLCDIRISTGKSDSITNEENLNMENMDDDSVKIFALGDTIALSEQPVSESVTFTFDNAPVKNLPPPRLFTKDTVKEQLEEAAWEPSWFSDEDKTAVPTQSWVGVPYTSIPQENYTIKTSLDREERIKALLAKQNQLLSKINSNFSGNS